MERGWLMVMFFRENKYTQYLRIVRLKVIMVMLSENYKFLSVKKLFMVFHSLNLNIISFLFHYTNQKTMKTKTFLLFCLFMSIAVTQLSAQNGQNGTGSVSYRMPFGNPFDVPVFCDGVQVDLIHNFVLNMHVAQHYQKGIDLFMRVQLFGEAEGLLSGEHFSVQEIALQEDILYSGTVHLNLKGSGGSHYIVTLSFEQFTPTPIKAVCH
jgi:hypothetical protein